MLHSVRFSLTQHRAESGHVSRSATQQNFNLGNGWKTLLLVCRIEAKQQLQEAHMNAVPENDVRIMAVHT